MEQLDSYIEAFNRLFDQGSVDFKPTLLELNPGEMIFHAEESARMIFGVRTGKIQLVHYLESGQMINQYAVESGAWFGEDGLYKSVYSNSAIAVQPSQIIAVPKQTLLTLLRQEPELALIFINQLTDQLQIAKNLMTLRCIRSAYDRVLAYLNTLALSHQRTFFLDRPIKEIAEQICLTPEVVSRSLRKLQDNGVIQRNQRKITLLEP
ncbi:MAG: Crp/Fnr family transcriptional regulator [Cyanobacteria bacterium P01_H01_bin.105]